MTPSSQRHQIYSSLATRTEGTVGLFLHDRDRSRRGRHMSTLSTTPNNGIKSKLLWAGIAALGAVSFGIIALNRGEMISAAWLVIAALCTYFIAYRFYSLFIAEKVLGVDPVSS